jgi:hypothetical protein
MQASMPAKVETSAPGQAGPPVDYARTVDELLQLYTRIDMAAVALPIADLTSRHTGKIGVRLKEQWRGIWMGELFTPLCLRPLVTGILHWHFHHRLSALRQHILLETAFSEDGAKATLARIDRAVDFWRWRIGLGSILFTWVLPLSGPVLALWHWAFPDAPLTPPPWAVLAAALFSVAYAFAALASAFSIKRGLMLGGRGRAAYRPDLLPESAGYAREKEILGPLGLVVSEFPLDLALFLGYALLFPLAMYAIAPNDALPGFAVPAFIVVLVFLLVSKIVWTRRKELGRA